MNILKDRLTDFCSDKGFRFFLRLLLSTLLPLLLLPAGCGDRPSAKSPGKTNAAAPASTLVFPSAGAYTGAYIDFGDNEDDVTLEGIEKFETLVGKHQAVIASSSFWGEQKFPRKGIEIICRHGSIPLIFWSPWDRPYVEQRPPDRFSLNNILAGKWDAYIDQWADGAKAVGQPLLVSWGLEMNGEWFPWSGVYFGGGKLVNAAAQPAEYVGPELYKQAFRYVVSRVRARGASNVRWVFHANNLSFPNEPWNAISQYYPGSDVVDVLALSVYGQLFVEDPWIPFAQAMDSGYQEIAKLDANKPLIVAEWAVGEFPKSGNKALWIQQAFADYKKRYPRVKAAVYWHERWENKDETYTNLRIHSSPEALAAYRQGVADPYWRDREP